MWRINLIIIQQHIDTANVMQAISPVHLYTFAYISPICGEAPHGRICMKFCAGGRLADTINREKFYLNQIRGFDSVGVEFLAFPYFLFNMKSYTKYT